MQSFLFSLLAGTAISMSGQAHRPTLYYIPHTHWEGAVFFTREEYLETGLSNILSAIHLLEKYPDYKFALDQVAYFKPFLERYPEEAAAFRRFVKEGRLELVGGMDVMPDDVKPGGELFVRQMQYGKRYCREQLGVDVTTAWMVDTFGHHPQMPQLLKLAGFKSFWFCRGVPNDKLPSEFLWKGIDGSTIPAFWLPGFYGLFYGPPRDQPGFDKFFQDRFNYLNPYARGPERVGLAGVDVSEPEDYVTPLVHRFNAKPEEPFTIRYSVPREFAKVVAQRKDNPVIAGDFNPIFQGTYSSRIELKQTTKAIEQELLTAEKLGAIANLVAPAPRDRAPLLRPGRRPDSEPRDGLVRPGRRTDADDAMLWRAWEPVLFNQTHDLASGVMADHVYADTVRSYAFSKRLADEVVADSWIRIVAHVDTSGKGIPIVVFNTQGWPRTDVADIDLGIAGQDIRGLTIVDPAGRTAPAQITYVERYSDGSLKRAKVSFLALAVPPLGYATYRVMPVSKGGTAREATAAQNDELENEFYRVKVNARTGEIIRIFDKTLNSEILGSPANIVARTVDDGDLWEPYHTLDGGMFIASQNKEKVPTAADAVLSTAVSDKPGSIISGPVFSEFKVSHPFGSGAFATKIRLTRGVMRIDIETELVNNEKHVRYRVLFPTNIKGGRNVQEIPFGSIERPAAMEYPAQSWVDYSDGHRGVALLNTGMPGNLETDGTLMLSLLRSQSLGDYNLGHGSDSGYELGVPRTFRYSLVPHAGDWRQVGPYRGGLEWNNPLIARKASTHPGTLPSQWSMVGISHQNVVLTAFKAGPANSTILRVYEASGRSAKGVRIALTAKISAAYEANLLEDTGRALRAVGNTITFDLHPFEIKTFKLELMPCGPQD